MPSITDTTFTIAELELSPFNVRPHTPDASELEPSILAVGLKEPILVHPMLGRKGHFGTLAGGRRLKAIRALIARGDLPRDWPVPVRLHEGFPDTDLELISFVENEPRKDLEPYERYAATRRQIRRGRKVDDLAAALGRDVEEVQRWLRLGQLAEPIFRALAAGEISDAEARAYAATEDSALQLATFERLRGLPPHQRSVAAIRAALGFDDAENRRWLAYVGDQAYRAAGGGFELDMFAEDAVQRGRVSAPGLLRELADGKLAALKATLREAIGRPELRFLAEPPKHPDYPGSDHQLRIAIGGPDEMAAASLPSSADVVGFIAIGPDGEPQVSWWWESRKAKARGAKPERDRAVVAHVREPGRAPVVPAGAAIGAAPGDPVRQQADAAIRQEQGLGIDAIQVLGSVRRRVLQAALIEDATKRPDDTLGVDLLVFTQLRMAIGMETSKRTGMRGFGTPDFDSEVARTILTDSPASRTFSAAVAELHAQPFMDGADLGDAFAEYYEAHPRIKRIAAAVVVSYALERTLDADGHCAPLQDRVAESLGLDSDEAIRRRWTPTIAFLDLIPARERLAIADAFLERVTLGSWQRLKSPDLSQRVLELITGKAAGVRRGMADAAARWVHPLLRFRSPPLPGAEPAPAAELREAAE